MIDFVGKDLTMMSLRTLAVTASAAVFMTTAASASTVTVNYQDPSNVFGTGSQNLSQRVNISSPSLTGRVSAGPFQLTAADPLGDFVAFCVDLGKYMRNGKTYRSTTSLFSSTVVNNLDKLFTSVYSAVDTAVEGAAFQVAIWEIVTERGTNYDLAGGRFAASGNSSVVAAAQTYLNGLSTASTGGYQLSFLRSRDSQNLVTGTPSPVPLPAAGFMLLAGIAGLGGLRRMRKS